MTERRKKFVVDQMHRRLAHWLRILGYDTVFNRDFVDQDFITIAKEEGRILITRDESLAIRARKLGIKVITAIKGKTIEERLVKLAEKTDISLRIPEDELLRCTKCNSEIKAIEREKIADRLLPGTKDYHDKFWVCTNDECQQIFWKGSHWSQIKESLEKCRKMLEEKKIENGQSN
ncbi:MAG: hypothetical protein GF308_02345 [Candidatus Heimdallarchaeota archaeon]|nr:hypothetical protein [Candidatus Heimdallarchaeota archaeon]